MPDLGENRFERLLRRFAIERFLYRLGRSKDRERFVLKGAILLFAFGGRAARPTRDLDLLGFGALGDDDLRATIRGICSVDLEAPDGVEFEPFWPALAPTGRRSRKTGRPGRDGNDPRTLLMVEISERSFEDAIEAALLGGGPDGLPPATGVAETAPPFGEGAPGGYHRRGPDVADPAP